MPQPPDIEIARGARLKPITAVAEAMGLSADDLEPYGHTKAKVHLEVLERLRDRPDGRYVVVTAVTPTPLGEGKTTTTVGLGMGLAHIGRRAAVTIRQPSLGPVFGIKGGAAGGGHAQVVPMEDINLHFTGDMHAVAAAHNLLAAFVDNHLHHGNRLGLDLSRITWNRVLDISDRALRNVEIGLGGPADGVPRRTHFAITSASEVMAILALTSGVGDLRARLGRVIVATDPGGAPVTANDLGCAGAMTVLLKQALMPNLVQTLEGTPAFIHCGPFANIAHGNSSILADRIALKLSDYVVTESGFGADMGFEKFCHIKCRTSGLVPDAAVVVATVRALRMHGGAGAGRSGRVLVEALAGADPGAVERGCANLAKQVGNVRAFGVKAVVCVNRFPTDTDDELAVVKGACDALGVPAVAATHWAEGGRGAADLARAVAGAAEGPREPFRFLYDPADPVEAKIRAVATRLYGADDVVLAPAAREAIGRLGALGFSELPVCVAKTHLSLSHDPALRGAPTGFTLPVRDVGISAGAGFLHVLAGDIRTMPGLPSRPAGERVDVDAEGRTVGLF